MIYYSSDFQCPISGVPVRLLYDEEYCSITAEICDDMEDQYINFVDLETISDTHQWCKEFYKYAETIEEANEIAERYDCWF